ncbi:MAG: hypothetical protein WC943_13020 [Elusimicrobiota bacterium]|jgi:hypothetical protein
MRKIFLSACLLAGACSKAQGPAIPDGWARYDDPGRLFSCMAPGDWRVTQLQSRAHRVTFHGPASGPKPMAAAIAVYRHEFSENYASVDAYFSAQAAGAIKFTPAVERLVDTKHAKEFFLERLSPAMHGKPPEPVVENVIILPDSAGFLTITHTAPPDLHPATKKVFDTLVESFQLP